MLASPLGRATEVKKTAPVAPQLPKKQPKTAETLYAEGLAALKIGDADGAGVALSGISPASPYAKLLRAQIAAANQDFDAALRLLLPLQSETGLLPQAKASLHATLARAYELQENVAAALEQRVLAEPLLSASEVDDNQTAIWKLLSVQSKEILVEIRGESADPVVQGWIDLTLAVAYADKKMRNIEQWRNAYPDHPARASLLSTIASDPEKTQSVVSQPSSGKIGLLLPLEHRVYGGAAKAVQAGVFAAQSLDPGKAEIAVYATTEATGVTARYQQAVNEGATIVIGPLTRDEVLQLSTEHLTVPVLALNQPEGFAKPQPNLMLFGLPVEAEARQVARLARNHGMQTALVVAAQSPLAERMVKAFNDEWRALDGIINAELSLPEPDKRAEFRQAALQKTADMIFLAVNASQAQEIRPWLDASIPTYGTSHVFDGVANNIRNQDLLAVHFLDVPWLVASDNPELAGIKAPQELQGAEQQRLFALGVDAYRLVPELLNHPAAGKTLLDGATGIIRMQENNSLVRELVPVQFRREGVVPESAD